MGEAWSDYYAMDYLVSQGLEPDTKASGEVLEGKYLMGGEIPFRTMAIDCPVASTVANCTSDTSEGGYTYGDVPTVNGTGPEVHASGEVWAQTLWDLRKKLGRKAADMVITRGMELSAADPTFLDMRNAIVQADLAVYGGSHRSAIWKVFAKRGMGWYAGTFDSADGNPVEDFHVPPAPNDPRSTVSGQVLDAKTGVPVAERARRDPRSRLGLHRRLHGGDRLERPLHDAERVHRHLPAGRGLRAGLRGARPSR